MIKYAGFQEKSFHIKGVIEKHMKDQRRKRRNEQHVEEEANFIGDILKLLFALSLAIVAIVVCFLFFKNIAGFSLPNVKATEAVVITEASKETKKKETEATTEKTTEETTEEETTTKSEETSKEATKESAKESTSKEESSSSKKNKESIGESPTLESQSGKKSSSAATKESTPTQKSSKSQGHDDAIVGEGPKSAEDSGENQGPGNP